MAKTTKKSKKPTKPAKKPFTVEIHGESLDLSLESRNVDDDDSNMFDQIFEKLGAYAAANQKQPAQHANDLRSQIISDLELIEAIAERDPEEDETEYATSIVAIAMAFGRKLDTNMLRVVIHTLQQEYNDRPKPAEPANESESATPHE